MAYCQNCATAEQILKVANEKVTELAGETARLRARLAGLTEFFWRCWDDARGVGREPDGGDIQEWGEKYGLLEKVSVSAPCGEGCVCEEFGDFPMDCYRPTVARGVLAPREEPQ